MENLSDRHYGTLLPDSTDHITTSTTSHHIDWDVNVSFGNNKIGQIKPLKLILIFTLLGHKENSLGFPGKIYESTANNLPENPLPTLMEMGLMIVWKMKKPYST